MHSRAIVLAIIIRYTHRSCMNKSLWVLYDVISVSHCIARGGRGARIVSPFDSRLVAGNSMTASPALARIR